jgi:hypothetical protein
MGEAKSSDDLIRDLRKSSLIAVSASRSGNVGRAA